MAQTILLFETEKEKTMTIQAICKQLPITCKQIPPNDYAQPLGALAGIQGFSRKKTASSLLQPALPAEMLVFSGMNGHQVDTFLAAYRSKKIAPIGLKAVLTPFNIQWTPLQLFQELQKEHTATKATPADSR